MFLKPGAFNLLFLAAVFALLLYALAKLRRRRLHLFLQKELMPEVAGQSSGKRHFWKDVLLILVVLFSILALARPRWGFEWQAVERQGVDIFVAIDTSKSMLTEDVKPNRLERAKLAVRDLLKDLKGDRVGLIAFAGNSFLVCPLTSDYGGVLLSLEGINTDTIPRGGTDLAKPIQEALKGYENVPARYKTLVLLTDGEAFEGDAVQWAKTAADKGIKVYTIGIGTKEGELVRVPNGQGGHDLLKDAAGNVVKSRLDEGTLQEVAAAAGGAYVRSSGAELGLDYLYREQLSHMEKREIESRVERSYHDQFQWPLGIAVILLLVETFLPWRRRLV